MSQILWRWCEPTCQFMIILDLPGADPQIYRPGLHSQKQSANSLILQSIQWLYGLSFLASRLGLVTCRWPESDAYEITLQFARVGPKRGLRGHPGVQKHCRATWTILIIQMCLNCKCLRKPDRWHTWPVGHHLRLAVGIYFCYKAK